MPRAIEKGYGFSRVPSSADDVPIGDTSFVVLGAEVTSDPGTTSAPLAKRAELMQLSRAEVMQLSRRKD